jgi:hypothetical protein
MPGIFLGTFAFRNPAQEVQAVSVTGAFSVFTVFESAINGRQMIRTKVVQS